MNDDLFSVQGAVAAALAASADVQNLLGNPPRVYDHVPPGADFPYATFGALRIQPYDDKTDIGFEQMLTLDIWSRYRGTREAKDIAQAAYNALHRASLSPASGFAVACEFHSADIAALEDGLTYHAGLRFTIITQSA